MNKNTIWLNQLFSSYLRDSKIKIYFEEKNMLKNKEDTINLSIHPLRFADDIFFNFETNSMSIKQKLKKYEVNYDIFYQYANLLKAHYQKTKSDSKIKEEALLIVGQTQEDKVLFDGKKYLNLLDFLYEIKEIGKLYKNIYFKPHPYAKNNKFIFSNLKNNIENLSLTHENIYYLLPNENIKCVIGLNSSTLYEAKYFHKKVIFLNKPYFDFKTNDIGIYGDYFSSSFWANILDSKDTKISLPFVQNRLRKSLNDFWAYNQVDTEIILKDIFKNKIKYFLSRLKS